eukprot:403364669
MDSEQEKLCSDLSKLRLKSELSKSESNSKSKLELLRDRYLHNQKSNKSEKFLDTSQPLIKPLVSSSENSTRFYGLDFNKISSKSKNLLSQTFREQHNQHLLKIMSITDLETFTLVLNENDEEITQSESFVSYLQHMINDKNLQELLAILAKDIHVTREFHPFKFFIKRKMTDLKQFNYKLVDKQKPDLQRAIKISILSYDLMTILQKNFGINANGYMTSKLMHNLNNEETVAKAFVDSSESPLWYLLWTQQEDQVVRDFWSIKNQGNLQVIQQSQILYELKAVKTWITINIQEFLMRRLLHLKSYEN